MNNKSFKSLKELILENPELPLIVEVEKEDCDFDLADVNIFFNNNAYLTSYYSYPDVNNDTILHYTDDLDDLEDYYRLAFEEKEEYAELSDDEYTKAIQDFMKENVKSYNAIVIRVDN